MTVDCRLVVIFNEVGLVAAVARLGIVSMTVDAPRKEISEGLLVHVLAEMGEVELYAVFPARKAAKPFGRAFVELLASSTVMIFEMKMLQASEG